MTRLLLFCLLACGLLRAADVAPADLLPLADESAATRIQAIERLAATGDPRLAEFLDDYRKGSAFLWKGAVVVVLEDLDKGPGAARDPLTRSVLAPSVAKSDLTELPVNMRLRNVAVAAINQLRLAHPDPVVRLAAVGKAGDAGGAANRATLATIAAQDPDHKIRRSAAEGVALIDLASTDTATRLGAVQALGVLASGRANDRLTALSKTETDPAIKAAITTSMQRIASWRSTVSTTQTIFSGLSAGSILIIMALGLAITFGLMGVINMAHGEMLMIGAYATLVVQIIFAKFLPEALMPYYFPVGLVAGFAAAAAVGWLLELTVIRFLYGRPLETLLATYGISMVLIWGVRRIFGDNQAVVAPAWLTGGYEPMADLVLPWNRIFIIAVTVAAVVAVWLLMNRSRLGLLLRATVQSRRTASSLGVDTRRIDGFTFALGSGLAGAAGCALTLIGGLKPDMGQEYIIDSFLVVAAGGVGNLWGVVCSGLGLGMMTKFLEPWTQTVYAKVIVLGLVILFLQYRPQGLFAPKGRLAND